MPLHKGKSERAFSQNVRTEMEHGKPQKQAVAIAYAVQRRAKKAEGGEMRYAEGGCVECAKGACMAHGDIVDRAMRRRKMAEGGNVSDALVKRKAEEELQRRSPEPDYVREARNKKIVAQNAARKAANGGHYSEGGMVSNDDEDRDVEFAPDTFDDMELDDHLEPHYAGSNEHGEDEMLYDDEKDLVKRAMRARKDKMPRPA